MYEINPPIPFTIFTSKLDSSAIQPFPKQALVFTCLQYKPFENAMGKEITRNEEFLLFPQFSTLLENFPPFSSTLKLSSANSLNLKGVIFVVWERVKKNLMHQTIFQIRAVDAS